MTGTVASCHCGAVTLRLAEAPAEVTECNCSLCRKYGVVWAYMDAPGLTVEPSPPPTGTYAWNGCHVDFHHCVRCGCVTHWTPRTDRAQRGVNARLLDPAVLAAARLRHLDGADTGKYLD